MFGMQSLPNLSFGKISRRIGELSDTKQILT